MPEPVRAKPAHNTAKIMPAAQKPAASNIVAPRVKAATQGGGASLDRTLRNDMSARFGHDFSQIRIHTDGQAAESAKSFRADAFAVGNDIVFGAGKYNPGSDETRRLLAHELTHVVQQEQFGLPTGLAGVSDRHDAAEQEADHLASQVMMGHFVQPQASLTAAVHCFQPPTSGDDEFTEKRNGDLGSAAIRGMEAIPGLGNAVSIASSLSMLGMAGYDTMTGDSKSAASDLHSAEDLGINAIPILGNARAAFQAGSDLGAVSNDYDGVKPKDNPDSFDHVNANMSKLNTGIGDMFSGLLDL